MKDRLTVQFWGCAAGFCLLWVLVPALFHPAYHFDVVELFLVGKEWVLSTTKQPMLPAWLLELLYNLTFRSFAAPFLASQICTLLTLWAVWSFGCRAFSKEIAFYGTLAMLPYWFFTVKSTTFNQNIVLIPCWTISIYFFYLAIRTDRLFYWIASGIMIGLAFYAKFSAVFLVITVLVYMFTERQGWRKWLRIGPYLSMGLAALVVFPMLVWLYQHDFVCLTYAKGQTHPYPVDTPFLSRGLIHLERCLQFTGNQFLLLIPTLLILMSFLGWRWKRRSPETADVAESTRFLAVMIGIPFMIHFLLALILGMRIIENYGAPFWPFFGVFLLLYFQPTITPTNRLRFWILLLVMEILMLAGGIFESVVLPYWPKHSVRVHFPIQELGQISDRIWSEQFSHPCPYTTGNWWIAGNAAISMKDRPSVLFYYSGMENLGTSPTGLWASDANVNEKGGLVFWLLDCQGEVTNVSLEMPDYISRRFPNARLYPEPIVLPYKTNANVPPVRVGIAIVPPK